MSDSVETLFKSPRSQQAITTLGYSQQDLRAISQEELKAKLGNMKITK